MPVYEYRCLKCHRRVAILLRGYSDAAAAKPVCTYCGHDKLKRLVSRVAAPKSEEARLDALADSAALGDIDENDPRSIARWMKKMSGEMGEDLGDEFREVVDRLEAGQAPEDVEAAMPDFGGPGPMQDI